jgi:hypothetical protein
MSNRPMGWFWPRSLPTCDIHMIILHPSLLVLLFLMEMCGPRDMYHDHHCDGSYVIILHSVRLPSAPHLDASATS